MHMLTELTVDHGKYVLTPAPGQIWPTWWFLHEQDATARPASRGALVRSPQSTALISSPVRPSMDFNRTPFCSVVHSGSSRYPPVDSSARSLRLSAWHVGLHLNSEDELL
jgi:hypothetical protein